MIRIIPSISVSEGKVVKKSHQELGNIIYPIDPVTLAETFAEHGFDSIFLTDLDGAMEEANFHIELLQLIKSFSGCHVNFSGGIRTDESAQYIFENKADSITTASLAVHHPEIIASWLISYGPERIFLGADVLDGKILTKGRLNDTGIKVADFISYFADRGIKYVKLTDVAKDGALEGPNFGLIAELRKQFPHIHFLSSGGIRHTQDIYELESLGVAGVIIARAFYEDLVSIDDLVALNNRRA
jgi:phosphoribosylformimino-5-aminoimidazole carboxamide ribotide isomerase